MPMVLYWSKPTRDWAFLMGRVDVISRNMYRVCICAYLSDARECRSHKSTKQQRMIMVGMLVKLGLPVQVQAGQVQRFAAPEPSCLSA